MDRGGSVRALQIDRRLNRVDLTIGESLWFEDRGALVKRGDVEAHPRIGVDYAGEWAKKPWRFRLRQGRSPHSERRHKQNREAPGSSAPPVVSR